MDFARKIRILVVEDAETDFKILQRNLSTTQIAHELIWVESGEKAIVYLEQCGPGTGKENPGLPHLILLDIRLPGKDGLLILEKIKENDRWRNIPIVVLTGSTEKEDVRKTYQKGGIAFLNKSATGEVFEALIWNLQVTGRLASS